MFALNSISSLINPDHTRRATLSMIDGLALYLT